MASVQPVRVKVVLLGDSGVGKSSLFLRLTEGNFFSDIDATMGASFGHQTVEVEGCKVQFNIWDTAGQERFRAVTKMYYKDAEVAILVYDISNRATFESLKKWHSEIKEACPPTLRTIHSGYVVVGNKEDLVDREAVDMEEAKKWAQTIVAMYQKTSAKSSFGIDTLFTDLAKLFASSKQPCRNSIIQLEKKPTRFSRQNCQC